MGAWGSEGLYGALEVELKKAKTPLDCVALFEKASIREHASSVNRVSDYLGHLWRKGKVLRLPAPQTDTSRSRWLYVWKPQTPVKTPSVDEVLARASAPAEMLFSRPNIEITEEGGSVIITLPNWSITIKKTG